MEKELTADNLKQELWDTLIGLKSGKIPYQEALTVAHTAKAITSIVKVQLNIAELTKSRPTEKVLTFNEK